jgi:hypothetical protein
MYTHVLLLEHIRICRIKYTDKDVTKTHLMFTLGARYIKEKEIFLRYALAQQLFASLGRLQNNKNLRRFLFRSI